jgi:Haloacid dehalogenase-like hydrolase
MKKLRGVIFGIDKVFVTQGESNDDLIKQIGQLTAFLLSKGITPIVLANRIWTSDGKPLEQALSGTLGSFPWFVANRDRFPKKPQAASIDYVLRQMGWDSAETIYVGNTIDDMRTAVNGDVLFLNATWYGKTIDYGFEFATPRDIAKFVDVFCLRDHLWHYSINDGVEYYALAPYSTYIPDFAMYSSDAKGAAKFGAGHPEFWTKYLLSTIYFSELHKHIDFIAPYPGHEAGSTFNVIEEPMLTFTKCFRITYLRDLIIRHTTAPKSSSTRVAGGTLSHLNQLNSIVLNPHPLRGTGDICYKHPPLKPGKTILLVDDICTQGYSLESARAFISQTGANAICLSWLKTINSEYERIAGRLPEFNPYNRQTFTGELTTTRFPYRSGITDALAAAEVADKLQSFIRWDWP